jgi:hypothetical protein
VAALPAGYLAVPFGAEAVRPREGRTAIPPQPHRRPLSRQRPGRSLRSLGGAAGRPPVGRAAGRGAQAARQAHCRVHGRGRDPDRCLQVCIPSPPPRAHAQLHTGAERGRGVARRSWRRPLPTRSSGRSSRRPASRRAPRPAPPPPRPHTHAHAHPLALSCSVHPIHTPTSLDVHAHSPRPYIARPIDRPPEARPPRPRPLSQRRVPGRLDGAGLHGWDGWRWLRLNGRVAPPRRCPQLAAALSLTAVTAPPRTVERLGATERDLAEPRHPSMYML